MSTTSSTRPDVLATPSTFALRVRASERLPVVCFFVLACGVYIASIWARKGNELIDDGAFFARYAENMAHGHFWVWNPGESPIWGSSAPLYPLLPALAIKLGVAPVAAVVRSGIVMGAVGLSIAASALVRRFGFVAGCVFVFLTALDTDAMYWPSSGLETPLTFLLLGVGLWLLLVPGDRDGTVAVAGWPLGLVAGLVMVHKLDLLPVGILLLAAAWARDHRFPRQAAITAGSLAVGWYGFAWAYFGAPVPNSFLTKALHQSDFPTTLDWTWFGETVLSPTRRWAVGLALLALLFAKRVKPPVLIFLGGTFAIHLLAYTVKHPFEPYDWYTMPAVFGLFGLAAIGAQMASDRLWRGRRRYGPHLAAASTIALLSVLLVRNLGDEQAHSKAIKSFVTYQEFDRAEAGRWVNAYTPSSFRVLTAWGNPAFYSHRTVVDASFLNRDYDDALPTGRDRPEVLIWQNNPGSTPDHMVFSSHIDEGYTPVHVFQKTYVAGMDYFFVVFVRDDVLGLMPPDVVASAAAGPPRSPP